tara:strand:+ start:46405 stop:46602 length:198 start_codon:yes stop_codon:yes gene_type:complete
MNPENYAASRAILRIWAGIRKSNVEIFCIDAIGIEWSNFCPQGGLRIRIRKDYFEMYRFKFRISG